MKRLMFFCFCLLFIVLSALSFLNFDSIAIHTMESDMAVMTITKPQGMDNAYFLTSLDKALEEQSADIMMRIVEILISVPYLIVVIVLSIVLNSKGMFTLILAMTITGWCGTARMVRAQMLTIKNEEYVLAAKALGVKSSKIIVRHMIPNTLSTVIVAITFDIPGYIFSEAFLSYLGLGIQPPNTSWGALASAAQAQFQFYPSQLFFPAGMIALTMLCFTLIGDGLRDALDPKLRK